MAFKGLIYAENKMASQRSAACFQWQLFDTDANKYKEKRKPFSINGEKFSHQAILKKPKPLPLKQTVVKLRY